VNDQAGSQLLRAYAGQRGGWHPCLPLSRAFRLRGAPKRRCGTTAASPAEKPHAHPDHLRFSRALEKPASLFPGGRMPPSKSGRDASRYN